MNDVAGDAKNEMAAAANDMTDGMDGVDGGANEMTDVMDGLADRVNEMAEKTMEPQLAQALAQAPAQAPEQPKVDAFVEKWADLVDSLAPPGMPKVDRTTEAMMRFDNQGYKMSVEKRVEMKAQKQLRRHEEQLKRLQSREEQVKAILVHKKVLEPNSSIDDFLAQNLEGN